uniref:Glycoside hydrolase family 19 catalytic domain-containing protein n=1 Tax=Trichuris muris TaxID=70415 RepID=A0A5S6R5T0_TRIMR
MPCVAFALLFYTLLGTAQLTATAGCPARLRFGNGPPSNCTKFTDPKNLPKSKLESWFTKEMFNDLFPKANLGWGPHECSPYNYESFIIAARYFPEFASEAPNNGYTADQNYKRDMAAFFAHAVQETGENDANLYTGNRSKEAADDCFYRGGFFNWFEGGPTSLFLPPNAPGHHPKDGELCQAAGRYCISNDELDYFYPCNNDTSGQFYKGCYFGRGAIQLSYNYNYGLFSMWLNSNGINVDLLRNPNLLMTNTDPPLAIMGSLWFYMTPQPPKPAMHDIVMGQWDPGNSNRAAGYSGPIFGPTSLIINNECNGEDATEPGGGGESRRIKAFKWFCKYFGVPAGEDRVLTCKGMPTTLDMIPGKKSLQPDWSTTWKTAPCKCAPANYGGMIPYFDQGRYPDRLVAKNAENEKRCVQTIYDNPSMYGMFPKTSLCLTVM